MTTRIQARDEMSSIVSTALSGQVDTIIWDSDTTPPPEGSLSWARVSIRHVSGTQATLGAAGGQRRWRQTGFLFVQLFTPLGDGLSKDDALVIALQSALRGVTTPSGVILRNVRATEVGADGAWHQTNVVTEFEYDEQE